MSDIKAGKKSWQLFLESKNPPKIEKKEEKTEEKVNPFAVCTASVGTKDKDKLESCIQDVKKKEEIKEETSADVAKPPEMASSVPNMAEGDDDEQKPVDEMTAGRLQRLEDKKKKVAEEVTKLDEEMAKLKEFGSKKYEFQQMQEQIRQLKEEMDQLKNGSGKKKPIDEGKKEEKKPFVKPTYEKEEKIVVNKMKANKSKKPEKDAVDELKKGKEKINEGYNKYLKNKVPANKSNVLPNGFNILIG